MDPTNVFIRLIIFLVIGVCVGVPAVSWALRMFFLHVRAGGRVSIFIIFLLLSDILEFILIPFLIASIVSSDVFGHGNGQSIVLLVFIGTRLCGFCFHQLVALESILLLMHPHCLSRLCSPFCSIPICLGISTCGFIFFIHPLLLIFMGFALFAVAVIVALLTCVFTATASCSSADSGTTSHKDRGTRLRVFAVAMGTLLILYIPFIVSMEFGASFTSMFACIMSFRVVADPLLCVLVCREIPQRQPTQTGIELNTVQTSD